jgi:hypothetical protein
MEHDAPIAIALSVGFAWESLGAKARQVLLLLWSAPTCRSFKTYITGLYPKILSEERDIRSI